MQGREDVEFFSTPVCGQPSILVLAIPKQNWKSQPEGQVLPQLESTSLSVGQKLQLVQPIPWFLLMGSKGTDALKPAMLLN